MKHVAHISRDGSREQTVAEHNQNVGRMAGAMLSVAGLCRTGELAGLLHDMGKCTDRFERYIRHGEGRRGSVIHTFQAVRYLFEQYHGLPDGVLASEFLAYACGAHHGLFDCVDEGNNSRFQYRLQHPDLSYDECVSNFFRECADRRDIDRMFQDSQKEIGGAIGVVRSLCVDRSCRQDDAMFYCSLLARLILSSVIDADRIDTASFMLGSDMRNSVDDIPRDALWPRMEADVLSYIRGKDDGGNMSAARNAVLAACCSCATGMPGVFQFKAPCGSGKTLAGLAFALKQASMGGSASRLIFTAPWLSILDQNAKSIREAVGVYGQGTIIECHSNVNAPEGGRDPMDDYISESWDAPVVITTAVQLFYTLFGGSAKHIRRFHALCGSVIVMDEVQAIPGKLSSVFALAVNFLTSVCGATVVLCSATQPCFTSIGHPIIVPVIDICPPDVTADPIFLRTELDVVHGVAMHDIADMARTRIRDHGSVLVVCNKRSEAACIYELVKDLADDAYHLSASMCQVHRQDVIGRMCRSVAAGSGRTAVCVATQVVEAGVDVSFGSVIRIAAGLDNAVQCAGRCNRHGGGTVKPVTIVFLKDESLRGLPDIQMAQDALLDFLSEYDNDPERFGGRLDSDASVGMFYQILYRRMGQTRQDGIFRDGTSLYELLSRNPKYCRSDPGHFLRQAFRTAGDRFSVFDGGRIDVVMPYGHGRDVIMDILSERAQRDPREMRRLSAKARRYSVSLFDQDVRKIGHDLIEMPGGMRGLYSHYDPVYGFVPGACPEPEFMAY